MTPPEIEYSLQGLTLSVRGQNGYTIAAIIANEFAEAEGNMHLSALIELGLVLFALTMVINGLAQILIIVTTKKGSAKG